VAATARSEAGMDDLPRPGFFAIDVGDAMQQRRHGAPLQVASDHQYSVAL
jgi:hypothetical protein